MNLKSKLNQLQTQAGSRNASAVLSDQHKRLKIPRRVGRQESPSNSSKTPETTLAKRLQGNLIDNGLIVIRKQIPLSSRLGRIKLNTLQPHPKLPGDDEEYRLTNVYIDTETTGLSGGSGTLAFLIGFAWLEASSIQLTQLLITRFSSEPEMLYQFENALQADQRLVSYNGKSYDLPLLISRYRMQSQTQQLDQLPHLDLLHPTRRLFRKSWPDCRLTSLENRLLGFRRLDDLPGSEAPAAWFDYLQRGRCENLIKVVDHNRSDIVSLVAAHTQLANAIENPEKYRTDLFGLARWMAEHDSFRACTILMDRRSRLDEQSKRLLAILLQKNGDRRSANSLWKELADSGCPYAIERLAKYHEHISKDISAAHYYCLQLPESYARTHRLHRLNRKAGISR
ncbi:MAG: ribonuclease H-like domain-containing protein [Candidatus Thiodiazotropha sp. LLP2]